MSSSQRPPASFVALENAVQGLKPSNTLVREDRRREDSVEQIESIPTSHLVSTGQNIRDVIHDASSIATSSRPATRQTGPPNDNVIIVCDTAPLTGQSSLEASFLQGSSVDSGKADEDSLDEPESKSSSSASSGRRNR